MLTVTRYGVFESGKLVRTFETKRRADMFAADKVGAHARVSPLYYNERCHASEEMPTDVIPVESMRALVFGGAS